MAEDDLPWEEIRAAFSGAESLTSIAARYRVTWQKINSAARKGKWPRPTPAAARRAKSGASAKFANGKAAPRRGVLPGALVKRIYHTIDLELEKLEQQKGASSQDRERASRALSQMVNSLEKAVEMQREMTKAKGARKPAAKDKEALAHAEDLRKQIAERLERLRLQRAGGK